MKDRMLRMTTNGITLTVLGILLLSNHVYSVCLDRERCVYRGDMTLISVKDCIRPMFECGSACRRVRDTVALHRIRGPTTYGIKIPQELRSIYQIGNFPLTYCIVRRLKNANGSLARVEHVPGCCPVKHDERCDLPSRKDEYESFSVVLPFNWLSADTPFCVHDISEKNPSYEIVDGIVYESKDFDDKNSDERTSAQDFNICAFGASSDLVTANASTNASKSIFVVIQGSDKVVESGGNFFVVFPNGNYIPCEIKRKQNGAVLKDSTYQGDYQCMVIVGPNNNGTVTTYYNATCLKSKGPKNNYVPVVIVVAFIVPALIITAVIYWRRKQLNEYKKTVKDMRKSLTDINLNDLLDENLLHEDATDNIDAMRLTESAVEENIEHANSRHEDECETDKFGENGNSDSGVGSHVDSERRSLDEKLAVATDCGGILTLSREDNSDSEYDPNYITAIHTPLRDGNSDNDYDPNYVTAIHISSRDGNSGNDYDPMAYVTAPHQNCRGSDVTRASPTSLSPFINPSGDDDVEQEEDPSAQVTEAASFPDYVRTEIFCGDPTEQDDLHDCGAENNIQTRVAPQQTTSGSVESCAVGDYVLHI